MIAKIDGFSTFHFIFMFMEAFMAAYVYGGFCLWKHSQGPIPEGVGGGRSVILIQDLHMIGRWLKDVFL